MWSQEYVVSELCGLRTERKKPAKSSPETT
jgi:hypothetical protein